MTDTHTAGSWTASTAPSTSGRGYDIFCDDVRIASTPGWHPDDARAADEAANARLIAAAPELLEACWEALNALALAARFCPDQTQEGRALSIRAQVIHESELIMAAIVKATGGQS